MRTLDKLPQHKSNDGYLHRVCIPCIYNSGRKATVRATIGYPEIIHISIDTDSDRPYQGVLDSYLHVDTEKITEWLSHSPDESIMGHYYQEALDCIEMIKGINKYYFAEMLTVLSDNKAIVDRYIPRVRTIKQIWQDMRQAYLSYNGDMSWLLGEDGKESATRKFIGCLHSAALRFKGQYNRIEQVVPLAEAHLGGTWQGYYPDGSQWLNEAETLKGSRIYLA